MPELVNCGPNLSNCAFGESQCNTPGEVYQSTGIKIKTSKKEANYPQSNAVLCFLSSLPSVEVSISFKFDFSLMIPFSHQITVVAGIHCSYCPMHVCLITQTQ